MIHKRKFILDESVVYQFRKIQSFKRLPFHNRILFNNLEQQIHKHLILREILRNNAY